jgi:hypothetical protein
MFRNMLGQSQVLICFQELVVHVIVTANNISSVFVTLTSNINKVLRSKWHLWRKEICNRRPEIVIAI